MNFNRISLRSFIDVLDAVAWNSPCTLSDLLAFTGLSRPTVVSALKNAMECGLILENRKHYTIVEDFEKNLSTDSKKTVIRRYLQGWVFFQQLCCFLVNSNGYTEAIRKTLAYNRLDVKLSSIVENILQFATDLKVLIYNNDEYSVNDAIKYAPHETDIIPSSLNSEMAVVIFLSKRLSPEFFHSLEKPEQEKLIKSLLFYNSDSEKSCEYAGQALENYLRIVGIQAGEDLTNCDGLGQIADYLAGKTRLIIHPKQRDIAKSISTIRNSSAHDRDKLTSDPWIKTSETALANALLVIQLIKSINIWITSKGQVI